MGSSKKFLVCTITLVAIYFFLCPPRYEEVEIPGWSRTTSRNSSLYIPTSEAVPKLFPRGFCDDEVFLLMLVCTAPNHFDAREAIRKTWGKSGRIFRKTVAVYFFVGEVRDPTLQGKLQEEHLLHNDLIQENFVDSYYNLTIKSLLMLKTVKEHCLNSVTYLLKVDDDMFVNVSKVIRILLERRQTEGLLMGKVHKSIEPIRRPTNKWYSPVYMFDKNVYPDYISGGGCLMTLDVAKKLYDIALITPLFHLEDVYFTGICAQKAGIQIQHTNYFNFRTLEHDICEYVRYALMHRFTPQMMLDIFQVDLNSFQVQNACRNMRRVFDAHSWLMGNIFRPNRVTKKNICY